MCAYKYLLQSIFAKCTVGTNNLSYSSENMRRQESRSLSIVARIKGDEERRGRALPRRVAISILSFVVDGAQ